jgi:osmotically-inducible protein OsmY
MRPSHTIPAIIIACILASPLAAQQNPSNQGTGERLGERIDRGMQQLSDRLQKGWADARKAIDELTIQGQNDDTIVLAGSVPTEVARLKAAALAQDTIGVGSVINQLTVAPAPTRP